MLLQSNLMKSCSLFLLTLNSSKSFLFYEISFVDYFNRVVLVLDECLFDDRNVWMLALVTLQVLFLHDLDVIPVFIDSVQTLMGKSQSWRSASTRSAMKINFLILMIDQITELVRGFENIFDILVFDIVGNLVSLILNSKAFELLLDLSQGNVPLSDFSISLKTENSLNLVLLNDFSDFMNINWCISYDQRAAFAFFRNMMER